MMSIPKRPLGSTGLWVSAIGFGTASIGFAESAREHTFVPLLRSALNLGITFFDTAPDYRRSEELLGRALRGCRDDVVLATKCGRIQSPRGEDWDVHEDWSEGGVVRSIERSLRRLETDYLDLVQLHSPPRWVLDDGGALQGLSRAQQAGKVRHIGVSADGAEAWRALELGVFATLQLSYSILQQEPEDDVLPAAAAQGVGLIIKQPIANAIPTSRERPKHPDWARKWDIAQHIDWGAPPESPQRLDLALRWVLANPLVGTAIVGTSRIENLVANVQAATAPPLDGATVEQYRNAYHVACAQLERSDGH